MGKILTLGLKNIDSSYMLNEVFPLSKQKNYFCTSTHCSALITCRLKKAETFASMEAKTWIG